MTTAGYEGVVAAVPVSWGYRRRANQGAAYFLAGALCELLRRSGLDKSAIDGLAVSSFTLAPDTAVGFTQYAGLSPRWLEHIPTGGTCGVVALRRAARAVQSGEAEVVACLSGDTANFDSFRGLMQNFSSPSRDFVYPYGAGGPNASFALIADHYMRTYGARREDFARIAVAQRANAALVPHAMLRQPIELADYLDARPVAEPIHLLDCVMPCAGAEAFLVMSDERARFLGLPHARLLAAIERHNAFPDDTVQHRGGWLYDRDALYEQAGAGPEAMDFVETYDDYPVISMMQFEDLGFCAKGEGPAFVREHDLTVDGSFPHNTCGGQLSVGQAGAAGGYLGLVEAVRQLTDRPLGAAVPGARHGLVSGFGMINYDRGVCSAAAVLGRAES
jgi:acetyl-CoA acetyltransferase